MNRLSDADRDVLDDEYAVMPTLIDDQGICRQASDRLAEIAQGLRARRDELLAALKILRPREGCWITPNDEKAAFIDLAIAAASGVQIQRSCAGAGADGEGRQVPPSEGSESTPATGGAAPISIAVATGASQS